MATRDTSFCGGCVNENAPAKCGGCIRGNGYWPHPDKPHVYPLTSDGVVEETGPECPEELKDNDEEDIVRQPSHYAKWAIEPITFIMRNGFEFWRGNIVKYASRAGFKLYEGQDATESEITDLKKVIRYAEMRINQLKGEPVL